MTIAVHAAQNKEKEMLSVFRINLFWQCESCRQLSVKYFFFYYFNAMTLRNYQIPSSINIKNYCKSIQNECHFTFSVQLITSHKRTAPHIRRRMARKWLLKMLITSFSGIWTSHTRPVWLHYIFENKKQIQLLLCVSDYVNGNWRLVAP